MPIGSGRAGAAAGVAAAAGDARTFRIRRSAGLAVVAAVVVLGDQLSKAWAWRQPSVIGRATIDTGGGVLDSFVGGAANVVMADPLLGAVADIALAALLIGCGRRLLGRPGSTAAAVVVTVLLAACASNLLDRLGLHRWTAPGSARGVVNWIPLGGGTSSPANAADLLIVAGVLVVAAAALLRFASRAPVTGGRRVAVLVVAAAVTAVSLLGAVGAADGRRERGHPASAGSTPEHAPARPAVDRGAPAVPADASALRDDLLRVVTAGDEVTTTWTSETVTSTGRRVLGWRTDGVSALYLQAVVAGPVRVELFLPVPSGDGSVGGLCQWYPLPSQVDDDDPTHPAAVWECNAGTARLSLKRTPVLFSS